MALRAKRIDCLLRGPPWFSPWFSVLKSKSTARHWRWYLAF